MKSPDKRAPRFDPTLAQYETERLLRDFAGVTGQQLLLVLSASLGELENAAAMVGTAQTADSIRIARAAAEKAQALARNLRFYASQTVLAVETIDLSQLLLDTVELVEKEFLGRGIQINVFAEASTLIVADPAALRQTLLNLLYTSKESIPEKGRITITLKNAKKGIAIHLADDGNAIEGDLSEVFEPHYNARETSDPRALGLAVVKVLVEAMGGETQYKPGKSGGNGFHLLLPEVHKPTTPSFRQRRRFRRVQLDLPVTLTVGKKKLSGRLKVLGKGGCYLDFPSTEDIQPSEFTQPVQIELFHFENEKVLIPKARIVDSKKADNRRGIGVSFEDVSPRAGFVIASLIQGHTE